MSKATVRPKARVEIAARAGREHVSYLKRHLANAFTLLKSPLTEVSFALVGDAKMADLHVQFMGIAGPTDVLTFELDRDPRGRVTAGEIVLCVPEAKRQAKLHGHTIREELLLYGVHGLLHLCGYDDRTDADHRKMHRKEDALLVAMGVGRLFKKEPA